MKRISCLTVAAVLLVVPHTRAQEWKTVGGLVLRSYQGLQDDLSFFGTMTNNPRYPDLVAGMMANGFFGVDQKKFQLSGIKGLDAEKPCGIAVLSNDQQVRALDIIGLADADAFFASLVPMLGEAEETDGIHRFDLPKQQVYLKPADGWLFMADDPAHLDPLPDAAAVLADLQSDHEITLQVRLAELSDAQRESVVSGLQRTLDTGLEQGQRETDAGYAFRRALAAFQLMGLEHVFQGATRIVAGVTIDQDAQNLEADVTVDARDGSPLAAQIANLNKDASRFGGLVQSDARLSAHVNMSLGADDTQHVAATIAAYRGVFVEALTNAESLADNAEVRQQLEKLGGTLVDLIAGAVDTGRVNLGVRITGDVEKTLVAAMLVADASPLDAAFEELAELAATDPGYGHVRLDVAKRDGARIHALALADPTGETLLMRLFGSTTMYFATAGDAVWTAIGPDALTTLTDAMGSATADAAPIYITVNTSELPLVLNSMVTNQQLRVAISMAGLNLRTGNDRVTLVVEPAESSLHIHVEAGDSVVRVMAVGLQMLGPNLLTGQMPGIGGR